MNNVALFYSDSQADWLRHLPALAQYDVAVIQAEFATAARDSAGAAYAEGLAPATFLERQGVDVYLYVNPYWVADAEAFGGPAEAFRKAQAEAVDRYGAWVRNDEGERILVSPARGQYVADITNAAYRGWLRQHTPAGDLFVDCGHYHAQVYNHYAGASNGERAEAMKELYKAWREQGRQIVVNSGWEPYNPATNPIWLYPFAGFVDGVAVEIPMGVSAPDGWWNLVSYPDVDLTNLRRLVRDWESAWLLAVWQRSKRNETYSPYATFAEHVKVWSSAAASMGVAGLACYSSTSAVAPLADAPAPPGPVPADWQTAWRDHERRLRMVEKAMTR